MTLGGIADLAILSERRTPTSFFDSRGVELLAQSRLVSHGIVMGGRWWPNEAVDKTDDLAHYVPAEGITHVGLTARHFGCNC